MANGVRVFSSGNFTLITATETALNCGNERRDDQGYHDNNTNPARLTVPSGYAGWYVISGHARWAGSNAGTYRQIYIKLNGAGGGGTIIAAQMDTNFNTTGFQQSVATLWYLEEGDYVELYGIHDKGSNLNIESQAAYSVDFGMVQL